MVRARIFGHEADAKTTVTFVVTTQILSDTFKENFSTFLSETYPFIKFFLNHPITATVALSKAFYHGYWDLPILVQIGLLFLFIYLCHRAFCDLVAAITAHLHSDKVGTPASVWGLRLVGEIQSIFEIHVSPFLKPYRGILHAETLPARVGPRPTIIGIAPQRQKNQRASIKMFEDLQEGIRQKAITYPRDLVFESSFLERLGGTIALNVRRQDHPAIGNNPAWSTATPYTRRPERSWIKRSGYEIADAHHGDGSLHVILHPEDIRTAIEQGWGELHPLASTWWFWMFYWNYVQSWWNPTARPPIPETLVLLYAPRNSDKLAISLIIVDAAIWFLTGEEVDSNIGKGTTHKGRYLDEYYPDGPLKVKGEHDAGWPTTCLIQSTAEEARADETKAYEKAVSGAKAPKLGQQGYVSPFPDNLTHEEQPVYKAVVKVQEERAAANIAPPKVVVITDLAKDYDDLTAMVVLKELHRLGLIELLGFVANLAPSKKRAIYGRGARNSLHLQGIPIAIGTKGTEEDHEVHPYEFNASFYTELANTELKFQQGEELLTELCDKARAKREKITFLLLSSLMDISAFTKTYGVDKFHEAVQNVVLQGGYFTHPLTPDPKVQNNKFDMASARYFHDVLESKRIPSAAWTKWALNETPIPAQLFDKFAATGHPIGKPFKSVQLAQDREFYKGACLPADHKDKKFPMTRAGFLKGRSSWFDSHGENDIMPEPGSPELDQYLTKVVLYDALPALAAAGQDVLVALKIKGHSQELHEFIGTENPPPDGTLGMNGKNMAVALKALLRGSLLDAVQRRN